MEASQVHLAMNHIPLAGIFFSLLFWAMSFVFKGKKIEHSAVYLIIVSAIFIIPVYLSGEKVERLVSRKAFVSKYYIQEHEEKAEKSLVLVILTSAVAILWLVVEQKKKSYAKIILYTVISLNILSAWAVFETGHNGGMIRHDQLRAGGGTHLEMD